MVVAWFGLNNLSNQIESPAPEDIQLLNAWAIINNSSAYYPHADTIRAESLNMTRTETLDLADWLISLNEVPLYESCCDETDRYSRCLCFADGDRFSIYACQDANLYAMSDEEYRDYVKKTSPCEN